MGGSLPEPDGQQDYRHGERQHVQDNDWSGRAHLLGDFQTDGEQGREPACNGAASPRAISMSSARYSLARYKHDLAAVITACSTCRVPGNRPWS